MTLTGTLTATDGRYTTVVSPEAPAHLRVLSLTNGQLNGARVGDQVTLEYYSSPSRGFWYVSGRVA